MIRLAIVKSEIIFKNGDKIEEIKFEIILFRLLNSKELTVFALRLVVNARRGSKSLQYRIV